MSDQQASERALLQEPLRCTHIDGLRFHFVEAGQGPPLVFLHGVLGDWRTWALLGFGFVAFLSSITGTICAIPDTVNAIPDTAIPC